MSWLERITLSGERITTDQCYCYKTINSTTKAGVFELMDPDFRAKLIGKLEKRREQEALEAEAAAHPEKFILTVGRREVSYVRK